MPIRRRGDSDAPNEPSVSAGELSASEEVTDERARFLATQREAFAAEFDADSARELAKAQRVMVQDALLGMKSIEDLNAILDAAADGGYLETASEALGILSVEHKSKLVDRRTVFLGWQFNPTDKYPGSTEFVSVVYVTLNDDGTEIVDKGVFNDGSTGVYDQLRKLTDRRMSSEDERVRRLAFGPLPVPKGLRVSTYDATDKTTGEVVAKDAQTFYVKG